MTTYLYSGTPGSGKSVHQAYSIMNQIKHRLIITNYSLNLKAAHLEKYKNNWVEVDNVDLTPEYLVRLSNWWFQSHKFREGAIKLYIDEAQILFNSRNYGDHTRMDWIKFFTQHRKYGYDIYLVSQYDRMLDRQIRAVIEVECKHRKLKQGGILYSILDIFLGGNSVMCIYTWYGMRNVVIQRDLMHIRKRAYKLFDSYKKFDDANGQKLLTSPSSEKSQKKEAPCDEAAQVAG